MSCKKNGGSVCRCIQDRQQAACTLLCPGGPIRLKSNPTNNSSQIFFSIRNSVTANSSSSMCNLLSCI